LFIIINYHHCCHYRNQYNINHKLSTISIYH
jgi:hypothetical protein